MSKKDPAVDSILDRQFYYHPMPMDDPVLIRNAAQAFGVSEKDAAKEFCLICHDMRFGCRPEDLDKWFRTDDIVDLMELGFVLNRYEVKDSDAILGTDQVLFYIPDDSRLERI